MPARPPLTPRPRTISAFRDDRRGNVAILTALTSFVMLALTGAGVDYARARKDEARLDAALDAAVLAGAQAVRTTDTKGKSDAELRQASAAAAAEAFASFAPATANEPRAEFGRCSAPSRRSG